MFKSTLRKILAILLSYPTNLPLTYLETKIGIKNLHRVTKSHVNNFIEHLILIINHFPI
nr:MAG TPA: hypothetical protein [Caudoviricetes sp.]